MESNKNSEWNGSGWHGLWMATKQEVFQLLSVHHECFMFRFWAQDMWVVGGVGDF